MFQDPVAYIDLSVVNTNRTKKILDNFHKYLKYEDKEELILDVGCGPGSLTSQILAPIIPNPNFRLIGVDSSKNFIDYAKNTFGKDPKISFRLLDITEKNEEKLKSIFEDEIVKTGFNKIFSFSVISWVKDYEQSLKNIYSLLKPGGQTLIWFITNFTFSDIWLNVIRKEKWQPYFKNEPAFRFPFHDSADAKKECTDLLKRIGFQEIICESVRERQVKDLSAPWEKIMQGINPYYYRVPEHLCKEYMDDCMEIFHHLNKKTVGLPLEIITIVATKPFI